MNVHERLEQIRAAAGGAGQLALSDTQFLLQQLDERDRVLRESARGVGGINEALWEAIRARNFLQGLLEDAGAHVSQYAPGPRSPADDYPIVTNAGAIRRVLEGRA